MIKHQKLYLKMNNEISKGNRKDTMNKVKPAGNKK